MNRATALPSGLPELDADSKRHMQSVEEHLRQQLEAHEAGFMPFEDWMAQALYAPGLGYYAAGNTKFGGNLPTGDFATAPELTPLFGQTLARQVEQILQHAGSNTVLEFGAGSGALAAAIIPALLEFNRDVSYRILEVSADLRARQQQRLAQWGSRVQWLDTLPDAFSGCVLANEVLDAMPVTVFRWNKDHTLMEIGVVPASPGNELAFSLAEREAPDALREAVSKRMLPLAGYQSEINLQAEAWMTQMGTWLERGAALLIDYGFPQREYYHPQRAEGTLMCHFRHHAHSNPLVYPGLQDITAHVDFTAMADAALKGGLEVLGYASQARFLMNTGLAELLVEATREASMQGQAEGQAMATQARSLSAVQKLLSEAEMGELFKVLAVGRNVPPPLIGFVRGDRRDRL